MTPNITSAQEIENNLSGEIRWKWDTMAKLYNLSIILVEKTLLSDDR